MYIKLFFFLLLICSAFGIVYASTSMSNDYELVGSLNCPLASTLEKDGLIWKVGEKWKSPDQSFSDKIVSFDGAEWHGTSNIGEIMCMYKGDNNFDLAIQLNPVNPIIALKPQSNNGWIMDRKKKDDVVCKSSNVYDCKFNALKPKEIKDIYGEIGYGKKNNIQ